ncbi:unnamed protein product, partial [Staurois parvus]
SLGHSRSPIHGKSRRCRLGHVISCGTDDQCTLMINVAPEVPPVSVHQCQLSVLNSAMCQCPSVPHISAYQCTSMPHSAHLSCLSVSPIGASQCHLSVPISVSQCRLSYQCRLSVPISD